MKLTLRITACLSLLLLSIYTMQAQDGTTAANKASLKKNSNISSKYDKSKNQTTVRLKAMPLTGLAEEKQQQETIPVHQMDVEIFFVHPGQQVEKPVENVTLRFHVTSRNYIFSRAQPVTVILDEKVEGAQGRLVRLGDTDYKSDLKFNSVYEEFMTITIPASALEKIAAAKTVSIYVGASPYQLKEKQMADLRDMASRIKP